MRQKKKTEFRTFHETPLGEIVYGDSLDVLIGYADNSVDLIMTSPPFGLVRKKDYGNVEANEYVEWFKPFAAAFKRVLKDNGSLVIDIGGAWNKGYPTRNLYHFKLLIMLCEEFGFHLAEDFYWWNPSKLPTPAEWVTVRRVRVKDAINTVWWLYCVVAIENPVAKGQQSPGLTALQPEHAGAVAEGLQGQETAFWARHQRKI